VRRTAGSVPPLRFNTPQDPPFSAHAQDVQIEVSVVNRSSPRHAQAIAQSGFSALEAIIALAIVAMLAVIAVPSFRSYALRAKVSAAVADISKIAMAIQKYDLQNNALPPDLATIGYGDLLDPWGNRYFYLSFDGLKGHGGQRKDKNLVPINTLYDLYSAGPDGKTRSPLTARDSRDDIIRANDGRYIGIASDY
jgi:general secretion pathway protein G